MSSAIKVECAFDSVPVAVARWIGCQDDKKLVQFRDRLGGNLATDHAGELVYLAPSAVNLSLTQERWPEVSFHATREQL